MPPFIQETTPSNRSPLSKRTSLPFILSFQYLLKRGYTFQDLSQRQIKDFQRFLNKIAGMTFNDVDKMYLRNTDSKDIFCGQQIIHYAVTDVFRIHGIIEDSQFKVLRLDPSHKFHK